MEKYWNKSNIKLEEKIFSFPKLGTHSTNFSHLVSFSINKLLKLDYSNLAEQWGLLIPVCLPNFSSYRITV